MSGRELISCTEDESVRQRARALVKKYYTETTLSEREKAVTGARVASQRPGRRPAATDSDWPLGAGHYGPAPRSESVEPQSIRHDLAEYVEETPERLLRAVHRCEDIP